MGESLFTLFASLARAIQFLIKIQKYQSCLLTGHGTINCLKEFKADVLNTFCLTRGLKTQNLTKNVSAHWRFCHPAMLQLLKSNFTLNVTSKEPKI